MDIGIYGQMILNNMAKKYPARKQELEKQGALFNMIAERESYILKMKKQLSIKYMKLYPAPKTKEMAVYGKYQELIKALVDEELLPHILEKI